MCDALGLTSDRVYMQTLLLEEFDPEIVYIKGVDNTAVDTLSRLEYDPEKNTWSLSCTQCYCRMTTLFSHYMQTHDDTDMTVYSYNINPVRTITNGFERMNIKNVYVNFEDNKEEIYPSTINEIAS